MIATELQDEIGVTITQGEYNLITRKRYLAAKKAGPLARVGGRRVSLLAELSRLATELALKKHQIRAGNDSKSVRKALKQARTEIGELREAATAVLGDQFREV